MKETHEGSVTVNAAHSPEGLSPQEMRLLKLLTEGHQNKTAAAAMNISVHTVSFHLRSIYEKLHVHSRSEAVARAPRGIAPVTPHTNVWLSLMGPSG
jgi:DNA-binding CsgD family transcriptional regulator